MKTTTIGLDIAKTVFHLITQSKTGHLLKKKQLKRNQVMPYMANIEPCLIVMEACSSAHYWQENLRSWGIRLS